MRICARVLPVLILPALVCGVVPAAAQQVDPKAQESADRAATSDPDAPRAEQVSVSEALKVAEEAKQAAKEAQAVAEAAVQALEELKAQKAAKTEKKERAQTYSGALRTEPGLEVGARLFLMWAMQVEDDEPLHDFSVNMARIKFTWSQWKLIEAVLKLDVDHLIEDAPRAAVARDVYVRVMPWSWLGLRIGQFKKPFSRLELMSRGRLPFVDRGVSNDWVVEELGYGDRDIGLQLEGRIWKKIKLDYMLGVFNGAGMNAREMDINGHKDFVLRLEARPKKWLSVGVNASLKFIEPGDLPRFIDPIDLPDGYSLDDFKDDHAWMTGLAWMTGADALVRIGKVRILVENQFGESWWFRSADSRYSWAMVLQLSYKWRLFEDWEVYLEPVLRGEMLSLLPKAGQKSARLWQVVPGINLHLGDHVRLMIDGEFLITQGSEPDESTNDGLWPGEWPGPWRNTSRLLIQVAFGI